MGSDYTGRPEYPTRPILFAREPRLDADAHRMESLRSATDLVGYLGAERARLLARILRTSRKATGSAASDGSDSEPLGGMEIAHALSDLTDRVVTRLFVLACEQVGIRPDNAPICIVATGGYGRRELAFFSDIDITFIPQRDGDPSIDRLIKEMFKQLMNICSSGSGLEVGYAYRLMEDCTSLDHQTSSGLLDARLIVGSQRLFIQFEDAFWTGFNSADFIFTKLQERERALQKWGAVPRVVEPQLKEGAGGLRDLHTMVWLSQARRNLSAARVRGERALEAVAREAELSEETVRRLAVARERLMQVRNALHTVTGAARDRLVVTRQEEVARVLGYERPEADQPAVERLMADLFPCLAHIRCVTAQVMAHIENSRLILGIGLDCKRRKIVPANGALETDDPGWLLWAFELAQRYRLDLGEALEEAVENLVDLQATPADRTSSAQVFTRILSQVGSVYPTLQKMADLGVLGWFLGEFQGLMDLIPYNSAHDYTVGQHTLYVIRYLEDLLKVGEGEAEEMLEMRRVLEDLPHPEQLMLAALLHDCGKADAQRPHAETGEEIATVVCRRLGWSEEATANVAFLVRRHLLMAETSRLRDLNLDETIAEFTRIVDDPDRLNMLYLLTYADTRAVGAGIWTAVKGWFLRELWRRANGALMNEESFDLDENMLARARRQLLKDLSLRNLPPAEVEEHAQAMPPGYLLNQSPNRIALHIEFVRRVRAGEPVIDFVDERTATFTELTVCAFDDPEPGLLARITGALYRAGLVVHGAQVTTRVTPEDRIALDVLWVDYRGRRLSPGKRKEVTAALSAALASGGPSAGRAEPQPVAQNGGRADIRVRSIRNDLSDDFTVIEVGGLDEQSALYWPSAALACLKWDIQSARVSVWQGEACAVFYVAGIGALPEGEVRGRLEQTLSQAGLHSFLEA